MGFQAFHTHSRSHLSQQPAIDQLGNIAVLDGRLDNYHELAALEGIAGGNISDSALVLKAFERLGADCFSHLVGDWALALWSARARVLYLARDHAGSRTLFYKNAGGEIRWSTYLETFFAADDFPEVDPEYIARTLSYQQVGDLTPYKGIRAVPPAHYLAVRNGQMTLQPHWRWVADSQIVYRSDTEYDEHFLYLFRQAVSRRIQPRASVLAELSGGMDSSSIVCMADTIASGDLDLANQIDTISCYDGTEPDWDERPYFTAVESHRNKSGIHLDCSLRVPSYVPLILTDRIYPYLGAERSSLDSAMRFENSVGAGRYRVILSGIGGDELLGGVPTPMPELANHLRAGQILKLISTAGKWCMVSRRPLLQMLHNAVSYTGNLYRSQNPSPSDIPPWLSAESRNICLRANLRRESSHELLTSRPSALSNGRTWWAVLETLPHLHPHLLACYEYRYPYLDRDLVHFLHRIPREQLVQPGRRRLLMRRALREIVPAAILERKRKAYISRGPLADLRSSQHRIEDLFSNSVAVTKGFIDRDRFLQAFRTELAGELKWLGALTRTISIELWLESLRASEANFRIAHPDRLAKLRPAPVGHTSSAQAMQNTSVPCTEI
jgi:asparagine synthase (glutamine-hydrolysing)